MFTRAAKKQLCRDSGALLLLLLLLVFLGEKKSKAMTPTPSRTSNEQTCFLPFEVLPHVLITYCIPDRRQPAAAGTASFTFPAVKG